MSDSTTGAPAPRYKFVPYGGGVEVLDRFGIRDRIRSGDIAAHTELAPAESDDWRAASSYPELTRYFEMAATLTSRATAPGNLVRPSKPRPMETMGQRVVQGLLYPLAGGEALMLVGLAILAALPVIGFLASLASTVIMVSIVRTSADGRTKMPLVDTSQGWELIRTYLRVLFVTLVSLLPVWAFGFFAATQVVRGTMPIAVALGGVAIGLAFAALYYPACLVTIAVWDNVLDSLNPAYVLKVIRLVGGDYFIAVAMWFVATLATMLMSSPFLNPLAAVPIVGGVFASFLSFWALFYASHLLGYAIYRHSTALGWD